MRDRECGVCAPHGAKAEEHLPARVAAGREEAGTRPGIETPRRQIEDPGELPGLVVSIDLGHAITGLEAPRQAAARW